MQISIPEETTKMIKEIYNRYYFGLFQRAGIAVNNDEEYAMRDAIAEIVKEIDTSKDIREKR